MHEIQIIDLDGRPAALAVAGVAHVGDHVPDDRLQHVKAKAHYALKIQASELAGPYSGRRRRALRAPSRAAAASPPLPSRPRAGHAYRAGRRRRPV